MLIGEDSSKACERSLPRRPAAGQEMLGLSPKGGPPVNVDALPGLCPPERELQEGSRDLRAGGLGSLVAACLASVIGRHWTMGAGGLAGACVR